jgi:hypothetical protein
VRAKPLEMSTEEINYRTFVKDGHLSTLRTSLVSIFQDLIGTTRESNKSDYKQELKLFLIQFYHDELCGTKIINQLITKPFFESKFKVALTREIYSRLNRKVPSWNLKRDRKSLSLWQLKRSFYSLYKVVCMFTSLTLRFPSYPSYNKENTVFIVGHTRYPLYQSPRTEFQDYHTYSQWRRNNGYKRTNAVFVSELKFFQLMIKENTHLDNLILASKVILSLPITLAKCKIRASNLVFASEQIFFFLLIKKSKKSFSSFEIAFSESAGSKRPLWTYELERRGASVTMIFFSNSAVLDVNEEHGCPAQFRLYSWTSYELVSKWQHKLIKEYSIFGYKSVFRVCGVPWFDDSDFKFVTPEKPLIAVFDIEPQLGYFGSTSLHDWGIGSVTYSIDFLASIMKICAKHDIVLMHKRKRELSENRVNPQYAHTINLLSRQSLYVSIPPAVAPSRLIEKVSGVISCTPTSTETLARHMDVPSIFFDPSGQLNKLDPALIESTVISSEEELENWIIEIKRNSNQG